MNQHYKIGIIGLGYVGLPLAVAFAKQYTVIGFDINEERVDSLNSGKDATLEISAIELLAVSPKDGIGLTNTTDLSLLSPCNVYIITVPTPIDKHHQPDLTPIIKASQSIGDILSKGNIVIYESTVYPGATEEICVPILEDISKLTYNKDFYVGYSPERINPGDKEHTVDKILKVTSGSTPEVATKIDALYSSIISAGTYLAPTIKVAEAAKVIENSQRDINIAFINELAMIFNKLGIDTHEVLKAAGTKWNFLPFKPGLVGGHCIGVDPYYLAQKAKEVGYHPEIILSGRKLNDSMGVYVANQIIKHLVGKDIKIKGAKILMLGITFKENCPDIRNTKVIDVIQELESFGVVVEVYDPWVSEEEVKKHYQLTMVQKPMNGQYQSVVHAVAHDSFLKDIDFKKLLNAGVFVYDIKGSLPVDNFSERL
jgi:UDP-N-acetyl-D-galactosamine dehydrogenase